MAEKKPAAKPERPTIPRWKKRGVGKPAGVCATWFNRIGPLQAMLRPQTRPA